jgi:3-hydroxyisobutyrate dehydrogenase
MSSDGAMENIQLWRTIPRHDCDLGRETMMRMIQLAAGALALVGGLLAAEAGAAELKVLSAGAMRGALQELAPAFETASGHKLKIEYATAGVVEQKVAAGDEIDVAILTKPRLDKLVREAKIVGGTATTLARAQIGLAVKKGAAKPDISSVEAFKKALVNAKSVAYADPASGATSGAYLAQALEKLGIAAELKPKTRLVSASGAQGRRVSRVSGPWPCTPPPLWDRPGSRSALLQRSAALKKKVTRRRRPDGGSATRRAGPDARADWALVQSLFAGRADNAKLDTDTADRRRERMELGYIGLGNMGGALARRLLREHKMRVFDLRPEVVARFADAGAVPTQSAQTLARESDMVMTCLPTSAEVRDVLFGEGRVAEVLRPGQIWADMTTGDPGETREMAARLAEKGVQMIDAPVSGGPHGANAGTIAIMVGAPPEFFARVKPIFETISPNIFHTGDVGTGHVMKLVNNVISAGVRTVTFEALAMGIKNGLSLETCTAVLQKGSARSATTELALPKLLKGDFSVSFTLALMHKDVRLATKLGSDSATPMVLANVVRELFQTVINEHGADKDTQTLVKLFERNAGVAIAPRG